MRGRGPTRDAGGTHRHPRGRCVLVIRAGDDRTGVPHGRRPPRVLQRFGHRPGAHAVSGAGDRGTRKEGLLPQRTTSVERAPFRDPAGGYAPARAMALSSPRMMRLDATTPASVYSRLVRAQIARTYGVIRLSLFRGQVGDRWCSIW